MKRADVLYYLLWASAIAYTGFTGVIIVKIFHHKEFSWPVAVGILVSGLSSVIFSNAIIRRRWGA